MSRSSQTYLEMWNLEEQAVNLLKQMVETPSVSGDETNIASIIEETMILLGYSTSIDTVGNVTGTMGKGSPHVLMCGHMDTVPGDLPISLENGILTGRGTVDAKGPLASFIIAGKQAVELGFGGRITLVGAVDEEGRNTGVKELIKQNIGADYAIFGEPTNVDTLTLGYKGGVLFHVKVRTETGHSSAPWLFVNAIEAGMKLFNEIKVATMGFTEETEGFNALTCTIRRIRGGGSHGSVPGECEMDIGFRIPPRVDSDELHRTVETTVKDFNSNTIQAELTLIEGSTPYLADPKSKLVKAFTREIYKQTKETVTLVKKSGTGDMNYYGSATGIPCVTYGPGDPHLDHTDREQIVIEDYLKSIEITKQALLTLDKLHS